MDRLRLWYDFDVVRDKRHVSPGEGMMTESMLGMLVKWLWVAGALGSIAIGIDRRRVMAGLILGAFMGPLAPIVIGNLDRGGQECEHCHEMIHPQATVCCYCGRDVGGNPKT